MDLGKEENFKERSEGNDLRARKDKEFILEENYKKAESSLREKKVQKPIIKTKKKPYFLLIVSLTIVAVFGMVIINQMPWMYIKYNSQIDENSTIEEFYYKNFENKNNQYYPEVVSLFEFQNGSYMLGLSVGDFEITNNLSYYSFIIWIAIGIIFLILTFLLKLFKISYDFAIILKSILCVLISGISIYLIYIFIKFISAQILLSHNLEFISQSLPNISLSFPTPLIIIIIMSFVLKINFSIIKINYRELQKIIVSKKQDKSDYTYEVRGLL